MKKLAWILLTISPLLNAMITNTPPTRSKERVFRCFKDYCKANPTSYYVKAINFFEHQAYYMPTEQEIQFIPQLYHEGRAEEALEIESRKSEYTDAREHWNKSQFSDTHYHLTYHIEHIAEELLLTHKERVLLIVSVLQSFRRLDARRLGLNMRDYYRLHVR